MSNAIPFSTYFRVATRRPDPYPWQARLAAEGLPALVDIPCGWGKTLGVGLGWAWRRHTGKDEPRHLIYCLPMRVLVEQTVSALEAAFAQLHTDLGIPPIEIHTLMGGKIDLDWELAPDKPWILVGTQDQLLSRALNRGYTISRYRWPVHFGLLNNDARWVLDEVQLMGPGLWTSAQLDWMRRKRFPALLPCPTTWMSATIEPSFLDTLDRRMDGLEVADALTLTAADRALPHARAKVEARRPVELIKLPTSKKKNWAHRIADKVKGEHAPGTLSLVVCNTVRHAQAVFDALGSDPRACLLTSRFRKADRQQILARVLDFESRRATAAQQGSSSVLGDAGILLISTQVVEAGVDLSAHRLWSELAPWASVVQRIGRLNRDGSDQDAAARFWFPSRDGTASQKRIGPYDKKEVKDAETLLRAIVEPSATESWDATLSALRRGPHAAAFAKAVAPTRQPMPRASDLHGLFSTEPDLHGGFTDVSAFIRGDDPQSDATVFWREFADSAPFIEPVDGPDDAPFIPEEGCQVAAFRIAAFLKEHRCSAFEWDDRRVRWRRLNHKDIRPGMLVMLAASRGGYSAANGWTGRPADKLSGLSPPGRERAHDDDVRSERQSGWVRLTTHLADARRAARSLVEALDLPDDLGKAVIEAAALHDWGKGLPAWQGALPAGAPDAGIWAKTPGKFRVVVDAKTRPSVVDDLMAPYRDKLGDAIVQEDLKSSTREHIWTLVGPLTREEVANVRESKAVQKASKVPFRPGLRHEAASALAMWHEYRDGRAVYPAVSVYLAAAHHGKVRTVLRSTVPGGHDDVMGIKPTDEPLVVGPHSAPMAFGLAGDGAKGEWTSDDRGFVLREHGWTALVAELLGHRFGTPTDLGVIGPGEPRGLGPFTLAYLEALVRIADWHASAAPSEVVEVSDD